MWRVRHSPKDLDVLFEPARATIQLAVDSLLVLDTENWQTIHLLDTMCMITNQAGCRSVLGVSLCTNLRNQDTDLVFEKQRCVSNCANRDTQKDQGWVDALSFFAKATKRA